MASLTSDEEAALVPPNPSSTGLFEYLPVIVNALAALVGGGVGSALVAGVVKHLQDLRVENQTAARIADHLADELNAFARRCASIVSQNNLAVSPPIAGMAHINIDLPRVDSLAEGVGWGTLNTEIRQLARGFKQRVKEYGESQKRQIIQPPTPADRARSFNRHAIAFALEAIDAAETIRTIRKIQRPESLREKDIEVRTQLEQQLAGAPES